MPCYGALVRSAVADLCGIVSISAGSSGVPAPTILPGLVVIPFDGADILPLETRKQVSHCLSSLRSPGVCPRGKS